MLDTLFPPSVDTAARRVSTMLIVLAAMTAFVFPSSASAGTEVAFDRYVTAGLLFVAGLLLRIFARSGWVAFSVLAVHAMLHLAVGGTWAAVFSAIAMALIAPSFARRSSAARAASPELDVPGAEIVRENVEAIVMALVLALTVREFIYEAFQIPTGSMQPTIMGKGRGRDTRPHGDRLLATKWPMLTGNLPRWSIVVFKYPLYRRINYIKRLVGLPGEIVEIRDGDVYIDNEISPKPDTIQESLWSLEFPDPKENATLLRAFRSDDGAAEWTIDETSASAAVPTGVESRVEYDEPGLVHDLRISVDFSREDDADYGALLLGVEGSRRRVEVEISSDGAIINAPGMDSVPLDGVRLRGDGTRYGLGVADRVVRVYVNGRVAARVQHADESNDGRNNGVTWFGLRGATGVVDDVRIDNDLQYSDRDHRWDVPDDGYIMLGDNTHRSKDSREWRVNEVRMKDGSVYYGEQSVRLEDETVIRFREAEGYYDFVDVDGVFRHLPIEDCEERMTGVSVPFVHEDDLIGRAFVIFFPFPPFGEFRPRLLP